MTLDAPDGSRLDAPIASQLDVRRTEPVATGVMHVIHASWITWTATAKGWLERDDLGELSLTDEFRAALAQYMASYEEFVRGQPWTFTNLLILVNAQILAGLLPLLPPELGVFRGTFIGNPLSSSEAYSALANPIGRPNPWRYYHSIDHTQGDGRRLLLEPGFTIWMIDASSRTPPLSTEAWVRAQGSPLVPLWAIPTMTSLPNLYQEWLETQP